MSCTEGQAPIRIGDQFEDLGIGPIRVWTVVAAHSGSPGRWRLTMGNHSTFINESTLYDPKKFVRRPVVREGNEFQERQTQDRYLVLRIDPTGENALCRQTFPTQSSQLYIRVAHLSDVTAFMRWAPTPPVEDNGGMADVPQSAIRPGDQFRQERSGVFTAGAQYLRHGRLAWSLTMENGTSTWDWEHNLLNPEFFKRIPTVGTTSPISGAVLRDILDPVPPAKTAKGLDIKLVIKIGMLFRRTTKVVGVTTWRITGAGPNKVWFVQSVDGFRNDGIDDVLLRDPTKYVCLGMEPAVAPVGPTKQQEEERLAEEEHKDLLARARQPSSDDQTKAIIKQLIGAR